MSHLAAPYQGTLAQNAGQYSLGKIVGIWLATGAPMWILGWLVYPALSADLSALDAGLLRTRLLTLGLIWQFVLAMLIVYQEEGNIRLSTIARRFRLNPPISPTTGKPDKRLWGWIIPLVVLMVVVEIGLKSGIIHIWTTLFPFFAQPAGYDISALFVPELRAQWVGAWALLGLFATLSLFNDFLGEEFIFRGVLLPKMAGVFGKWDWVINGVIFGFYHFHQPWGIPTSVVSGLIYAFAAKRFQSTWFSVILHSAQSVYLLFLILGLILGLA